MLGCFVALRSVQEWKPYSTASQSLTRCVLTTNSRKMREENLSNVYEIVLIYKCTCVHVAQSAQSQVHNDNNLQKRSNNYNYCCFVIKF